MAAVCSRCGKPLGFVRRLTGRTLCAACRAAVDREEKERQDAARAQQSLARSHYQELLSQLDTGKAGGSLVPELQQAASSAGFSPSELAKLNLEAFRRYALTALADDILSVEEEQQLDTISSVLGVKGSGLPSDIANHLLIASATAGRLPVESSTTLICKRGEVVHLEWPAALMKEVTMREYRGGFQGFSFPIGKTGIRYRVGGVRGHS